MSNQDNLVYICRVKASSTEWVTLEGKLHLEARSQKTVFYIEGPPSGVEILVASVTIKPVDFLRSKGLAVTRQASNSQAWHR